MTSSNARSAGGPCKSGQSSVLMHAAHPNTPLCPSFFKVPGPLLGTDGLACLATGKTSSAEVEADRFRPPAAWVAAGEAWARYSKSPFRSRIGGVGLVSQHAGDPAVALKSQAHFSSGQIERRAGSDHGLVQLGIMWRLRATSILNRWADWGEP